MATALDPLVQLIEADLACAGQVERREDLSKGFLLAAEAQLVHHASSEVALADTQAQRATGVLVAHPLLVEEADQIGNEATASPEQRAQLLLHARRRRSFEAPVLRVEALLLRLIHSLTSECAHECRYHDLGLWLNGAGCGE